MTGRLRHIGRTLAPYANDLSYGTPAERDVAAILTAVNAAILLDATGPLAEVVAAWWDAQGLEAVRTVMERRQVID